MSDRMKFEERQSKCDEAMAKLEEFSIDEILRSLIKESDEIEVVCTLDFIVKENNNHIYLYNKSGIRIYPAKPDVPPQENTDSNVEMVAEYKHINPVENVYKGSFFKGRNKLNWRVPIVCDAICETFRIGPPEENQISGIMSIIDCGCAIGDYVNEFINRGIPAWGIEGSEAAKEFAVTDCINYFDLRVPFNANDSGLFTNYDNRNKLCMSLEVAEHIEPEYADIYLNNLCYLSDTIIITAAGPGQKGHGHVNCQKKDYWVKKMMDRNYQRQIHLENKFARILFDNTSRREILVYANNVLVFKKINMNNKV